MGGLVIFLASSIMWGIYVSSLIDEARSSKSVIRYDEKMLFLGPCGIAGGLMMIVLGKRLYRIEDGTATEGEKLLMFVLTLSLGGCGFLGTLWTRGYLASLGYHHAEKQDPAIRQMQDEVRSKYSHGPSWRSSAQPGLQLAVPSPKPQIR